MGTIQVQVLVGSCEKHFEVKDVFWSGIWTEDVNKRLWKVEYNVVNPAPGLNIPQNE